MVRLRKNKLKYKGIVEDVRIEGDSVVLLIGVYSIEGEHLKTVSISISRERFDTMDKKDMIEVVLKAIKTVAKINEVKGMEVNSE